VSVGDAKCEAPWAPSTAAFRGRDVRTEAAHLTFRDPTSTLDLVVARREEPPGEDPYHRRFLRFGGGDDADAVSSSSDDLTTTAEGRRRRRGPADDAERSVKCAAIFEKVLYDDRDSPAAPTKGGRAAATLEVAGASLLGDAHFVKLTGAVQRHARLAAVPAPKGFVSLSLAARAGVAVAEGSSSASDWSPAIPRPDRFYVGGPLDFRGFDRAGVGPRSSSGAGDDCSGDPAPEPSSSVATASSRRPPPRGTASSLLRRTFGGDDDRVAVHDDEDGASSAKPLAGRAAGGVAFGTVTALLSAPLIFKADEPNADRLRGHVFATAGTLLPGPGMATRPDGGSCPSSWTNHVRASAGVGVSFSPTDLIRLELNYATFLRAHGTDLTKRFHFGISGGFG